MRRPNIEKTLDLLLDFGADGKGLIPVATQDAQTRELLLVAFANRLALDTTLETLYATYWSRSRNKLWVKGRDESGNLLKVVEIRVNCEQDSLLYLVEKVKGGACHAKDNTGANYSSCYYRRLSQDGKRLELI
jgi:phosphoribosyl-AMP cyclohydrolase